MRPHSFPRPILAAASVVASALALASGCSFGSDGDSSGEPDGGSLSVTGTLVDFQSGVAITATAGLSTSGLLPAPELDLDGAAFDVSGIPANSAFQLLTTAPPTYRATFSPVITVGEENLTGISTPVVSEAFLAQLATAFGVVPTAARGILLARVVDGAGAPKAGVSATSFSLKGTGISPAKFLDMSLVAAPAATVTSSSGWVVFFEVPTGVAELTQAAAATVTLEMANSPINPGTVTIAEIKVTDGAPPKFTNVSFSTQILPIFAARGCTACHGGKGSGGLTLNGGKVYKELLTEDPTRVRVTAPEQSLLLTMPSREDPPDRHPNVTFASANDPDFQKIYVWIKEGAKEN
jgi:hypothetical protein